jgi:germination protein YpeB
VGALAAYGIFNSVKAEDYRKKLDAQYNRAFFDLVGHVNDTQDYLLKAMVSSTAPQMTKMMEQACRSAVLADTCLNQLPIDQGVLNSVSKYLVQVSDVTYSLSAQGAKGTGISPDQYKMLNDLFGYSEDLTGGLNDMANTLYGGTFNWADLEKKSGKMFVDDGNMSGLDDINTITEAFHDYPSLIYDGPFSDHMTSVEPKGLPAETITPEEGAEKIKNIFTAKGSIKVDYTGQNDDQPVKTFSYSVEVEEGKKSTANIDLTQQGGLIYWMLWNRDVGDATINIEQAKQESIKFMDSLGMENMKDSYYVINDGIATINYCYYEDNILFYPDMVKIEIALDNGEVLGFESRSYITNHTARDIKPAVISKDDAQNVLNPNIDIISSQETYIPTEYATEIHAYEFHGKINGRDFLIYINADNGEEEQILILIEDDNGSLTV